MDTHSVTSRTTERVTSPDVSLLARPEFLPESVPTWAVDLAASVLVIVVAWVVARLLVMIFGRRIARHLQRPSLTRVSLAGIRVGVYTFALLTLMRIHGLDLGNIALSVTVFSAVVGVILAPIVGSIISGMFLLADQPYEIGDMIELADENKRGFVEDITLRYTKIFTLDNTFLVIPNGEMRERDVINYSAEDSRMRMTLDAMITYESDVAEARRRMEESARSIDGVISGGPGIRVGGARYPAAPDCLIGEFGDDGILLRLRYWVNEPYRMQTIQSRVRTAVWDAFEGDAVEIAYPHSHLIFDETSGELQVDLEAMDSSGDSRFGVPGDHLGMGPVTGPDSTETGTERDSEETTNGPDSTETGTRPSRGETSAGTEDSDDAGDGS